MNTVHTLRIAAISAVVIGLITPVALTWVNHRTTATAIATLGWACFVALPLLFPAIALLSGKITSETSLSLRAKEPWRYWIGLVTFEILFLLLAALATLMFHAYISTQI